MFPTPILAAYLAACLVVVLAPGPDNLLAIGRGMSQGRLAAALSSLGAGMGIMGHTLAATFGLSLVIRHSPRAFLAVKALGAGYLIWLGWKALRSGQLVSFTPGERLPLHRVWASGLLSNLLNPKPGLFVLAFLPQFVDAGRGSVQVQMLAYGALFALLTTAVFSLLGAFASGLSGWLQQRPRVVRGVNIGAGLTFIAAGLSVLSLKQRGTV
ncbi:MAG: LysE family translocator [Burkholderiales bacterium]|nr:LysE family translocator [Burkholderiales bacterium]